MYKIGDVSLVFFDEDIAGQSDYKKWFTNKEVVKFTSHGIYNKTVNDYKDFFNSIGKNNIVFAIMFRGKHVGNVSLQSIDYVNRSAELAIVIGESNVHCKGIGYKACKAILIHAFEKLNMNRVWTGTSELNLAMQKIAKKIGMTQEGAFRKAKYSKGNYVDIYEYAILRGEYDELK